MFHWVSRGTGEPVGEQARDSGGHFFSKSALGSGPTSLFRVFFVEERGIASQPLFLQVRAAGIVVVLS